MTQRNFLFKYLTQRTMISFFFEIMTQRIELFSKKSKSWSFFYQYDSLQEFKPFEPFHMTQRIEHFFWNMTQWIELFFNLTQRIEPCLKMTQRIEPFPQNDSKNFVLWILDSELFFFFSLWLLEWYCFVYFDFYNWTFFILRPKGLNFFWFDLTQWIVFSQMSHRIEHFFFFLNTTERIEHSEYDSKNWTTLSQNDSKTWTFSGIWLNGLNFFQFDSKNWTFFCHSKELNLLLLFHDAKNWTHFSETQLTTFLIQRIEPSFHKCLEELNFLKNMTHRTEPFSMWLTELNPSFQHES